MLKIFKQRSRAGGHLHRVQVCMRVRVFEVEVAELFTSELTRTPVYAQAYEAVLLVTFCCAKSLLIHAVPPRASPVGEAC